MAASSPVLSRLHAIHPSVSQPFHVYGGAYSFEGSAESYQFPLPSLHGGEGSFFQGYVPFMDKVHSKSVVGVKPNDFGVLIGYQVMNLLHHIFTLLSWERHHTNPLPT